jgi:antitoxin YefM
MVITASEARAQLFPLIEQVNNDSTPIIITSKKGNAVLVSESEWESILETMYLLRTPTNRERLARSRADVLAGNLYEYELPIMKASQGKKVSLPAKKIAKKAKKKTSV